MVAWNANGGNAAEPTPIGLYNGNLTVTTNFSWGMPYGGTDYIWPNWRSVSTFSINNGIISQPGAPSMSGPSGGNGTWPDSPLSAWAKPISASVSWTPTGRETGQSKYYKIVDDECVEITYKEYMELPENKENSPS